MRIGIYLGRHAGQGGGIGVYARAFIEEALKLLERPSEGGPPPTLIFYGERTILSGETLDAVAGRCRALDKNDRADEPGAYYRLLPQRGGRYLHLLVDQLLLPMLARRDRLTLLHSIANIGPIRTPCSHLITVHDLFQAWPPEDDLLDLQGRVPEEAVLLIRSRQRRAALFSRIYRSIFRAQLTTATGLITDSVEVAEEIHRRLGFDRVRTSVIPLGLDRAFLSAWPGRPQATEAAPLPLAPGFVLLHASLDPRKNLLRALHSCRALQPQIAQHGLVVLGADETIRRVLQLMLPLEELREKLHLLPHQPRESLPGLYSKAAVLLNPSLAEGFGLPAVEALAMGARVVSGPLEALRDEGIGKGRIFICNPRSVESITAQLTAALAAGPAAGPAATPLLSVRPSQNGAPRPRAMAEAVFETFSVYRKQ